MESIEVFWCIFGLIIGFVCCHFAYKETEYDGNDQGYSEGQHERDTDIRIYIPERIRSRSCNHGRDQRLEPEEKAIVLKVILHDYGRTLTPHEKEVLQAIMDEAIEEEDREETIDPEGTFQKLDEAVTKLEDLTIRTRGTK